MTAAFILTGLLIALIPVFIPITAALASGLLSALMAIAMAIIAVTLPSKNFQRWSRLFDLPVLLVLLLPLVWMLLQILPMTNRLLVHPIWASAAGATGRSMVGAISLDVGATLIAFTCYGGVLAAGIAASIVSLNRSRAERLLTLLVAVATLISAAAIGGEMGLFPVPMIDQIGDRTDAATIAMIGLVLSCATTIRAHERIKASKSNEGVSRRLAIVGGATSMIAFLACLCAVLVAGDVVVFFAALFGCVILLGVSVIRKLQLGSWGQAGLGAVVAVALAGFVAAAPVTKDATVVARMLSDAKWAGSGAGSFAALLPIYRDTDPAVPHEIAPAAATMTVEMGRPFLCLTLIFAIGGAAVLFRRALLRGRDYIYPGAGAGSLMAIVISMFATESILALPSSLMAGITLGLAIAQSRSERNGASDSPTARIEKGFALDGGVIREVGRRAAVAFFAIVLAVQAAWLLPPELTRPNDITFPHDQRSSTLARIEQEKINRAASLATTRGDLWAQSAFTYAGQIWADQAMDLSTGDRPNTEVMKSLTQALRYAPHRGEVWLMFAAMADRYRWQNYQPRELLKMSYYTAPNDIKILPLRLNVSLHAAGVIEDDELRDMIRRDVSFILTRAPSLKPNLTSAYRSASQQGKALVEQLIAQIDPGYLGLVRAKYP
jgi:hypothetical protein